MFVSLIDWAVAAEASFSPNSPDRLNTKKPKSPPTRRYVSMNRFWSRVL